MIKVRLKKNNYPEVVIRKSVYSMTTFCKWELEESRGEWIITLNSEASIKKDFDRILNDNILRFKIDEKTLYLREEIIKKSLQKVYNGL